MFDQSSSLTLCDLGFTIVDFCPGQPMRLPGVDPCSLVSDVVSRHLPSEDNILKGRDFYLKRDSKFVYAFAKKTPNICDDSSDIKFICLAVFPIDHNIQDRLKQMSAHLAEGGPANELKGSVGSVAATLLSPNKYRFGWAKAYDKQQFCPIAERILDQIGENPLLRMEYIQSHMKAVENQDRQFVSRNLGWRIRAMNLIVDHATRSNLDIVLPHHKIKLQSASQGVTALYQQITDLCLSRGYVHVEAQKQSFFLRPQ